MLNTKLQEIKLINGKTLLKDVGFLLEENSVFTIVGKNGSGKSTLIKALTGLLDDNFYSVKGIVEFDRRNILSLEKKQLLKLRQNKIKYVFQDAKNSFDQLKKLKYNFKKFVKDKIYFEEICEYFLLPPVKTLGKMYPYELSGGMAQRLSFAITISSKPSIIILDEPTSGIDAAINNLLKLKMKDFVSNDKNSILLVTQDLKFAEKASDKIAFLTGGRLSEFFTVDQFFVKKDESSFGKFLNAYEELSV